MKYILIALLLTSCVTQPEIKEVKIPIPVKCTTPTPAEPTYYFDQLTKENTLFEKVRALLADRQLYLAYQTELKAALDSCK